MFGGDDVNPLLVTPTSINDGMVPYSWNAVSPMQFLAGSNVSTMNNTTLVNLPVKLSSVAPIFSQQKLPVTLIDADGRDEGGNTKNVWKQVPVSTGLKLSYGEEDHNSSVSSASESARLSYHDSVQMELLQQNDELDQFIRIQEENMRKGIVELTHRHTMSLLNALGKEVNSRIRKKNAEIEALNSRNKALADNIRQLATEAQSWHYKAKQNESLVNSLRTNINQIFIQQAAASVKEGYDENTVDDATSSCVRVSSSLSTRASVICKGCKNKEVCVLLLPCRHLCLCTECEVFVEVCPVCQVKKAGSLQVYMP